MNLWVFWISIITTIISVVVIFINLFLIFHKSKKPYITTIIFVCIIVIGVPLIINESYKAGKGYITMWNASHLISYFGSILGAFATIIAIILTVIHSNKENNYKESYC